MRPLPLALLLTFLVGRSAGQVAPSPAKGLTLGSQKTQPGEGMMQGLPGSQYALFLQNKKHITLGTIRSASFFIDKDGSPARPFRVHLYKANSPAGEPSLDLLTQRVVVSAAQGGKWFTVNLKAYGIAVPQDGFFVAMEWIEEGNRSSGDAAQASAQYQILRPTFEFSEHLTWTYAIGKGWGLLPLTTGQGRSYNAMIKAEVDMIKQSRKSKGV